MDSVTLDHVVRLFRWHGWIPLLSLAVGAFIRLSKSDAKVAWFPNYIRPENRPLWALGISLVAGAAEEIATGGSAFEAVVGGILAANTAIGGHEILSKVAKKIRDRRSKSDPPPPPLTDWADDSLRPPPPPAGSAMFPKLVALSLVVLAGCAYRQAVCQVIDLASEVCPLILVKLPDGGTEVIEKHRVAGLVGEVQAAKADAGRPPLDPNPYVRDAGGE